MLPYIGEFVGTALLILLGTGVVANVILKKSNMNGGGVVVITIAWGLAVMIPAYIFGAASGAHFNPALTVALAVNGTFPWEMVPGYFVAQMAGGFLGGVLTHTLFKDHLDAEEDAKTKLGVFCTAPSIPNYFRNSMSEIIGTFVLVFAILGIAQVDGIATGLDKIFVFGIIVSIGMSLGGLTGYAINPARDMGPRLAHFVMPIKGKGDSNFRYAMVPFLAPYVGGILAVLVYNAIPWQIGA
ncbi:MULTISPECIES: MIP/aquaporin family protein [unclassified Anaerobiospirillum]|uniref:MIP/aquaporin family protein n=1 Tax=unclassified Anaerobiospirillum TaxID=2647410 RepID=UPI001FF5E920|nr:MULTISPECIES: MIP/aquaporin family protein [unclassified Anaerobiospirillum]MCK0535121.1 aquaporin family protein [Anaerobiospirillum sp. NML120511]MCK0540947.1 aquaporin family protein [Anaerobiospirillum sp. NML02-A-032]